MDKIYQEKVFITSNDVDDHYDLKISTIFKYLQQVSTNHSELLGIGMKTTLEHKMFWVITRMHVKIIKMPKMLETLTVTTHPGDLMMFVFPRYYEVYNESGELCIVASAAWVLLDVDTHKVVTKPYGEGFEFKGTSLPEDISMPGRVIAENLTKLESRKVRYNDIDLNGHLNNTKYIDYIIDTHDIHFYKKYRVSEILINYEKEIRDGDIVDIYSDSNIPEIITGDVSGNRSFGAKVSYIERKD